MLSILIPVYNRNVSGLVESLHKQCKKASIGFEIICFDDASSEKYQIRNREISSMFNVSYIELRENKGVSTVRNMLAQNARFDNLLFLDCDSKIGSQKFIQRYIDSAPNNDVICGGRKYASNSPADKKKILHWKYGKKREEKPAAKRNVHPYMYFHSNNFLINRKVFLDTLFNNKIKRYGYDDLHFAHRLKLKSVSITHIDNPVVHLGLEAMPGYLEKIKSSLQNLADLYQSEQIVPTRLTKAYELIKRLRLERPFLAIYRMSEYTIERSVYSHSPSLRALDIFKLYHFIKILN